MQASTAQVFLYNFIISQYTIEACMRKTNQGDPFKMMQQLFFVLAGVLFGMANVIPGVSGGTMAVVFGVYERLIGILSDPIHNIKKEWKFLVTFGIGLIVGILAFGKLMNLLLESKYRSETFLFFIGVILGSLPMLFRNAFMPDSACCRGLPCPGFPCAAAAACS